VDGERRQYLNALPPYGARVACREYRMVVLHDGDDCMQCCVNAKDDLRV